MLVEPGIYVDDSGNPGADSGSIHLSETRKSWTAVIIPPSVANDCSIVMETFLKGIARDYSAEELHFTEIFSGKGIWKQVGTEDRIKLFRLMSSFLTSMTLPIVHVTTSQETLNDHSGSIGQWRFKPNQFWKTSIPHLGFLRLCMEVSDYVREMREDGHPDFDGTLPLISDEGLAAEGRSVPLPNWGDVISGPTVKFARSQDVAGIQIADFAAFTISRTQWIIVQRQMGTPLSRSDEEFLSYGSGLNIVNLPMVEVVETELSKESYELLLQQDRATKGMAKKPTK